MRLTDMLKPKTQTINQDGTTYEFTPGQSEASGTVVKANRKQTDLVQPIAKAAKIAPYQRVVDVAAPRG